MLLIRTTTLHLKCDGNEDALSASEDDEEIAWSENSDGGGTFGRQTLVVRQL